MLWGTFKREAPIKQQDNQPQHSIVQEERRLNWPQVNSRPKVFRTEQIVQGSYWSSEEDYRWSTSSGVYPGMIEFISCYWYSLWEVLNRISDFLWLIAHVYEIGRKQEASTSKDCFDIASLPRKLWCTAYAYLITQTFSNKRWSMSIAGSSIRVLWRSTT